MLFSCLFFFVSKCKKLFKQMLVKLIKLSWINSFLHGLNPPLCMSMVSFLQLPNFNQYSIHCFVLFCFCWKWNYRGRYKYLICHWKVTHPEIQINIKQADLYSWMKKSYNGWLCLVHLTKFKKIIWKKKRWKETINIY